MQSESTRSSKSFPKNNYGVIDHMSNKQQATQHSTANNLVAAFSIGPQTLASSFLEASETSHGCSFLQLGGKDVT
jgi:hypothetical protein